MRVVFMGTPDFSVACLDEINKSVHDVVGVVTVPDKPAGRGQRIHQSAVKVYATKNNLPIVQPEKLKDETFINQLKTWNADAFVVVAFRMLPKIVWQIPPKGTFNLHASLLPQYRGAAPINWAIINGETKSGVTTFFINEEIDTGNILLQESVQINTNDNAGHLHDSLMNLGKKLIIKTLNGLADNDLTPKPQEVITNLKSAPKLFKEDGMINWDDSIQNIHNKIRGLSPYPCAFTTIIKDDEAKQLKIYKGNIVSTQKHNITKPKLEILTNELNVILKDGIYKIDELQLEGKRKMHTKDFLNGLSSPIYLAEN